MHCILSAVILFYLFSVVQSQDSRFTVTTTSCSSCPGTCNGLPTVASSCNFAAPTVDSCVTCFDDGTNSRHNLNFHSLVIGQGFTACDTYQGCPGPCGNGPYRATYTCGAGVTQASQCVGTTKYTYKYESTILCPTNSSTTSSSTSSTSVSTTGTAPVGNQDQFIVTRTRCTSCPATCESTYYSLDTKCNFTASGASSSCQICDNPLKGERVYMNFAAVDVGDSFKYCGTLSGCSGCSPNAPFDCNGESATWSQCVGGELWSYTFNSPTLCSTASSTSASTTTATTAIPSTTSSSSSSTSVSTTGNSTPVKPDMFVVHRARCNSCPNDCDPVTLDTQCNFTASTAAESCQYCHNPIKGETVSMIFDNVVVGDSFNYCGTLGSCYSCSANAEFVCKDGAASWSQCVLGQLYNYTFYSPTLCSSTPRIPTSSGQAEVTSSVTSSLTKGAYFVGLGISALFLL